MCLCMSTCTTCAKPSRPPPPKQRPSAPPSSMQVGCPQRCAAVRHERWSSGGTQLVKEGLSCTHSGCCFSLFWHHQHQQCQQHQQPALLQALCVWDPHHPAWLQDRCPLPHPMGHPSLLGAGPPRQGSRPRVSRCACPPDAAGCIVAWLPWTLGLTGGSLSTRP